MTLNDNITMISFIQSCSIDITAYFSILMIKLHKTIFK